MLYPPGTRIIFRKGDQILQKAIVLFPEYVNRPVRIRRRIMVQ